MMTQHLASMWSWVLFERVRLLGADREGNLHEVAVESSEDGLVRHHTDTLPLPLNLYDDWLQSLDHIHVALPAWVPAHF